MDTLARTGELDNTLIVYTSDNGFMHGEHRALAEKVLPYEESIRVPLVMRGPGVPRGRVDRRLGGERRTCRPRSWTPPACPPAAPRTAARCSSCWPTRARSGAATS